MSEIMTQNQSEKPKAPPKDERELVKYVQDKLDSCKKEPYELQAYLNISYFAGKQWVALDNVSKKLIEPLKEAWQIRYVANRIQPIVRTELAKITKNKFTMFVAPATNEDNDIKASRTAEKIIQWLEYSLDLQEKDRENCLWGLTTGISFIKPHWNQNKGTWVPDAGTGTGEPEADVVSIFELKWDQSASKWDEVRWICHEKVRDVDYIYATYGKKVEPENGIVSTNIYEAKLQNLNSLSGGVTYKKADHSVVVREYWELPSRDFPKGRRITIAADQVLFYDEDIGFGEQDDTERELPFFPFFHINVPGRLIPTSVVEQLLPIQREYNKSRSQIIENKNLMANPIWLVPNGCLDEELTNMPGGYYEYNAALGKPEVVSMPQIGADVYNNLELCKEEMDFVSGQHETSHGQVPTGVKSGTAISYLQEQDDTKLSPTIANFITCKQKYMRYLLKMMQKNCTAERALRIVGENKKIDVVNFKGSDLTSIDVRVQEASMYRLSRAGQQEWIMQLVQYKALDPVQDRPLILKMLELGITDDIYDEFEIDTSQAQGEQDLWSKGDMSPIVRDFYRHEVHIKEHDRFRKGELYNSLPPEMQLAIDAHVQQHLSFIANKVLSQPPTEGIGGANAPTEGMPTPPETLAPTPTFDNFKQMQGMTK